MNSPQILGASLTARLPEIRDQFPALARQVAGRPAVFLDGPAGSQVPRRVADAMARYLTHCNANHGGLFATSTESDALLDRAHRALADLLGADDPDCVVFGANMTTLTLAVSRALARTWKRGDRVLVTRLDHDANVSPWVLAARDAGAEIEFVEIDRTDCTLDLDDLRQKLARPVKLVAVGCASNASGTINPVKEISRLAHAAGALVYLDAVHYAPHQLMDVVAWDCDFLACSAYKFFGPHLGVLWGRRQLLESLPAYKVEPAPNTLPGKWMTGTQSHEAIAGALEAVEYLADLGRSCATEPIADRRSALQSAYREIARHEQALLVRLLRGLAELPGVQVHGIVAEERLDERLPTVSFTHPRFTSTELARRLGELGIFTWHGNYYALQLTRALGLEPDGMLRVGLLHYNTREEVDRLLEALAGLLR